MSYKLLKNRVVIAILAILIVTFIFLYNYDITLDNSRNIQITKREFTNDSLNDQPSQTTTTVPQVPEPEILVPTGMLYEEGHVVVDPYICRNPYGNITLIIMVTSAVKNIRDRMAIRLTWGHWTIRSDVKMVFMVGQTFDEEIQSELEKEQNQYHDVIQGHFVDTYNNLTLKTVFMLEWITINCPNTNFVLKTDDDMFINVPKLLDYISNQDPRKRTFYGKLSRNWIPSRDPKSRYYVSFNAFKDSVYPEMNGGPAYMFPGFLASEMFQGSLKHTFFKLEDVFLTGLVAKDLGISHTHWNGFYNAEYGALFPCMLKNVASVHKVKEKRLFEAWLKVNNILVKCK